MITIIEPHADDCYLSLGAHCEAWIKAGEKVKIVTVYSGTRKRGLDAQNYAEAIGADWLGLGFEEGCAKTREAPPAFAGSNLTRLFLDLRSNEHLPFPVIVPLAITHPEHFIVRKYFEVHVGRVQYYLDAPYQITQKNSQIITELLKGMKIVSYIKPSMHKWRHIKYFKDQSKFWHYNPPEKLRECFELIVERQ